MIHRHIALVSFLLALSAPVGAEPGEIRIEAVNADVFRTVHYIKGSRPNGDWDEKQTTMFMRAIMKDGQYDDAERVLAKALQVDPYALRLSVLKSKYYAPGDLVIKGSLPVASRMQLADGLTPEHFAAEAARQVAPAPGESQVGFFLRKGDAGMAGLISHAAASPQNWVEARTGLLNEFRQQFEKDSWSNGYAHLRDALRRRHEQVHRIKDDPGRGNWKLLLTEAAIALDYEQKGKVPDALYIGGDAKSEEMLVEVCKRLGIRREELITRN
jgi:hypothetical protein